MLPMEKTFLSLALITARGAFFFWKKGKSHAIYYKIITKVYDDVWNCYDIIYVVNQIGQILEMKILLQVNNREYDEKIGQFTRMSK